ncbi:hypothetical protein R1flu_001274 [Riccia fluitans]|uniref:Uncharacterized protein n=1 Tax=Riccia fluitans TaxID=41844 RepID=A0ABD1Y3T6_9MARC
MIILFNAYACPLASARSLTTCRSPAAGAPVGGAGKAPAMKNLKVNSVFISGCLCWMFIKEQVELMMPYVFESRRLHMRRLMGESAKKIDCVEEAAEELLNEGWLLCFDEFQLYKNGLQRELFISCIELIKQSRQVFDFMKDAPDNRLIRAGLHGSGYFPPLFPS